MGAQLLLIPALFVTICVTFIILHSCYHRWKMSTILKKKRDAAKISLVNILQMTNPTLVTPAWSANGAIKSNTKPTVLVSDETSMRGAEETEKFRSTMSSPSSFDPRYPNVLSSVLTVNDLNYLPPPCYEDLYGPDQAVFTFKSLSPEREEPPPFSFQLQSQQKVENGGQRPSASEILHTHEQHQYSQNGKNPCLLQVPAHDAPVPFQERRNSSAVLYL